MLTCGALEGNQLVPTLGQGQEQGQKNRADQEPAADVHVDGKSPGHGPQDEAQRDRQHIQDDHVFQPERIGEVQHDVRQAARGEPRTQDQGGSKADHEKRWRRQACDGDGQRSAGQGSEALARVQPVSLQVREVVDEIDRTGEDAEDDEGQPGPQDGVNLEEML